MPGRKPRPGLRSTYRRRERDVTTIAWDGPCLALYFCWAGAQPGPHAVRTVDSTSAYTDTASPITISIEVFRLEPRAD
jgi:hypothetical protein